MSASRPVFVYDDERMLHHAPDAGTPFMPGRLDRRIRQILDSLDVQWTYPEAPGRLLSIRTLLAEQPVRGVRFKTGQLATERQLARVHASSHLKRMFELAGKNAWLDVDTTAVSPGSIEAARVAAGTSVAAVEAVVKGRAPCAFALVRPPGHHAESVRSRGFCFFNNVAVAAAHARSALGCERVLIVDWDVHHGNGTQEIFYSDPDVLLFDIHRAAPFYPGSGDLSQVGAGIAEGTTVNVPLPGGSGDLPYLRAMREILVPAADWFKPDLVLVSAGFDPHPLDLAMNVSYAGFQSMTALVRDIAERHAGGRLAFILEGGYTRESLSHGVRSVLEVLTGALDPVDPPICGIPEVEEAIAFHRTAFEEQSREDEEEPTATEP